MRALVLAVVVALLLPAYAAADADPPSDVLLVQDTYYPYAPPASRRAVAQLDGLVAAARKGGFPVRVALVATRSDLGAIPDLFGHAQRYAAFLEQEITRDKRQPLLVVMPAGYGVAGTPPRADQALRGLPSPGATGDALARAAVLALPKLAATAGVHLAAPKPVTGGGAASGRGRKHSSVLPFLLPVVVLVGLGLIAGLRGRRRGSH